MPDSALPVGSGDVMLGPATRLMWRAPDSVHLELGGHGVIVDGLPGSTVARLAARGRTAAPEADLDTLGTVRTLTESGFLWTRPHTVDLPVGDVATDERLTPPAPRLAGELGALAVRHGEDAARVLRARRRAGVQVRGEDRLAVQLAALLAAAGVGRVESMAAGSVRLQHAAPGGVLAADEGLDLAQAAARAVRRAAPDVDTGAPSLDADLTVLVGRGPVDDDLRDALHSRAAAHLAVTIGADFGVVGPLVLPGLTSCLRCADLHRCDRDPAWPALAVQLAVPPRHAPPADIAVTTLISAAAALQVLAYLDGTDPATVEGTLELHLPDWRLRRRRWPLHPECACVG